MYRTLTISLPRPAATALITLAIAGTALAQVSPAPTMAPLVPAGAAPAASAPAAGTPADGADFVVVREAIGRQDYTAARAALDVIRQTNPNASGIALYESMIERRQGQGQTLGESSPVRTPRAGVTPAPTPIPTATPVATPVSTPLPQVSDAPSSVQSTGGTFDTLTKNPYIFYGAIAFAALILLGMGMWIAKRRGRNKYASTEVSSDLASGAGSYGLPEGDAYGLGGGAGLSAPPVSTDYGLGASSPDTGAYGNMDAPVGSGAPLGGGALTASSFAMPTFGLDDDEEEVPRPKPVQQAKPVEDEGPVNIFDEPTGTATPPAAASALSGPAIDEPSFTMALPDDETKILPPQSLSNTTPSSTPSLPGNVDLEDIFGSQPLPGSDDVQPPVSAPKSEALDDGNFNTLSTFVSTPGADNPEDSMEGPPPQNLRQSAPANSETQSISFDELFGSNGESDVAEAPAEPASGADAPQADVPPAASIDDTNLEALLAASFAEPEPEITVGDSATADAADSGPVENLDERSERMFLQQMDKARHAVEEKNWRQAVHFLSIASALHPENDEAKQMLKDARAEKRKSEESV